MKRLPIAFLTRYVRLIVVSMLLVVMLLPTLPLLHFFGPVPAKAADSNPIQVENSLAGDPTWNDFSASLQPDVISGYASKISVNHGDSIDFYVTTTAPSFTIDIYRTGYYAKAGARKITSLGSFTGVHSPLPNPDPVTGIITCNWAKTTTLAIPSNWVTGVYLARLNASDGNKSFIFFVVRNDGGHEGLDFQTSVTTYQAYNTWGGTSLYNNNTDKSIFKGPHATKVSFDRPFNPGDSNGAGHYLFYEFKFVYWLESQGYDVTYTTDVDTDTNVNPLTNHHGFLSVGHDEYWSKGMRDNVQAAINAGVNAAFFSANAMYWQIRFEPNAAGVPDRVEVGYKDYATATTSPGPDPQWHVNNAIVTTNWRADPVNNPENALIGVMFEDEANQSYPFVVQNASNWVYAGTEFVNGSSVPGIVGYEYDKVFNNGLTPAGITILGNSPVDGTSAGHSFSNATLYTAPSGARVFAAGTIQWSWGLANIQSNTFANAGIQRMTANILSNFINGTIVPSSSVNLNPTSVSFGNQNIGTTSAAQTVTLSNSGSAALSISNIALTGTNTADFAQTNTCPGGTNTLAAGSSCTISITFTPGATGARSASLTVTDNATNSPQTVALSGTGTTATSYFSDGFENGNLNAWTLSNRDSTGSAAVQSTVVNSGSNALALTNASGQYAYVYTALPSGPQTQTFTRFSFRFGSNVTTGTQLAIARNSNGNNVWEVDFNANRHGLDVYFWNASGGVYAVFSANNALSANTWYSIEVQDYQTSTGHAQAWLNGTSIGSVDADLSMAAPYARLMLFDSAPGTIYLDDVAVSNLHNGTIVPSSSVNLNPTSVSFGNQNIGTTSAAQTVTLSNSGSAALSISNIALTGTNTADFAQTNTCPGGTNTLAAGSSCTISITFTPAATGARSASLTVTDNATDSPQTVALSGTGTTATSYFSDGFENGNLNAWTLSNRDSTGSAAVQSTVVNSGSNALALTNASGQYAYVYTALPSGPQTQTFTRFSFRFGSNVTTGTQLAIARNSNGNNVWEVDFNANRHGLDVYFWNASGGVYAVFSANNALSANTWYSIEVQDYQTSTGHAQAWLNGTSIGSVDADLSMAAPYARLMLFDSAPGTIYLDDVAVSNP